MSDARPRVERADVVRLWFHRQGLAEPRGSTALSRATFSDHLWRTGALQIDPMNVVTRAHYLTLWSRFGDYDTEALDRLVYGGGVAYEYWGHEASILPIEHLPLGRRRMRRFPPPSFRNNAWWTRYDTSPASKRRVLRRLREDGPIEGADLEKGSAEDRRSLKLLWHAGKAAIHSRRHFRLVYDVAERVYPDGPVASHTEYFDSWLLIGLSGNGVAAERDLVNYFTGPSLTAAERRTVIRRALRVGRVVEVEVPGRAGPHYALPEHLEEIGSLSEPRGTTLLCPFDSFLWQRDRAEDLLGFRYRVEIYVPPAKREFGYYVLPVLHDGRLVARVDLKLHRDRGALEARSIHLEEGFRRDAGFDRGFAGALDDLRAFLGADGLELPRGWGALG